MAQRDRRDIQRALTNKGFIEENNDHFFYTLEYKGKKQQYSLKYQGEAIIKL